MEPLAFFIVVLHGVREEKQEECEKDFHLFFFCFLCFSSFARTRTLRSWHTMNIQADVFRLLKGGARFNNSSSKFKKDIDLFKHAPDPFSEKNGQSNSTGSLDFFKVEPEKESEQPSKKRKTKGDEVCNTYEYAHKD